MTTSTDPILLTVEDAAAVLSIGRSKTWELIAAGELGVIRLGRRTLIPREELERYVTTLVVEHRG
jgi:excisionase family DNA binding protein